MDTFYGRVNLYFNRFLIIGEFNPLAIVAKESDGKTGFRKFTNFLPG